MKKIFTFRQKVKLTELVAKICGYYLHGRSKILHDFRGGKMIVYANDFIGNAVNAVGFYELTELDAVFSFLSPLHEIFKRSVALDIGANVGNHSIYFSRFFDLVYAFEPHPVTSKILEINASFYPGIKPYSFGLSDVDDYLSIEENPTNLGGSRITIAGKIKARVRRLDDLEISPDTVALIKLDVEGHEAAVLRGGLSFIRASMPIILFEAHTDDFKEPMEEVLIMTSLGYRFVWIGTLGHGLERRIRFLIMLLTGNKKRELFTGLNIEPGYHSMVIGVPPRWHSLLGVE